MKWCESDAIATVMQILTFFSFWKTAELSYVFVLYRLLVEMSRTTLVMSHIIGAHKIGDSRKEGRGAADSQRRGPRSSRLAKKKSAEQNVWEPLVYGERFAAIQLFLTSP